MTTEKEPDPSRMEDLIIMKSVKLVVDMVTRFTTLTAMRLKKSILTQAQSHFPTTHRQQSLTRSPITAARFTTEDKVLIISHKRGTTVLKIL